MAGSLKWVASGMAALGCVGLSGCSSLVNSHRQRVDRIYAAHGEMVAISQELRNIEQVMLYAGRIHSGELANAALDVAIAIHGEPDGGEKVYARNITADLIRRDGERAAKLVARRDAVEAVIAREKVALDRDIGELQRLEAKYEYVSRLIAHCAIGLGFAIFALLVFKFLLRS